MPLILLRRLPQTCSWKAGWCSSTHPILSENVSYFWVYLWDLHLHVLYSVLCCFLLVKILALMIAGSLNLWKLQSSTFISSFPHTYHLGNYISQSKINFCNFSPPKLIARFFSVSWNSWRNCFLFFFFQIHDQDWL